MIITIDGPAGSGKSTVARQLAEQLGFHFLNTGAMYRAIALQCVRAELDLGDDEAVARRAAETSISFPNNRPHVDGEDVTEALRLEAVSVAASRVAMNPRVRERLVELQRQSAEGRHVVTEGRDQGTVVFPEAEFKVFLTASAETRARRRFAELATIDSGAEEAVLYETVLGQIRERDDRDANRALAPLRPAADAVVVDTSEMTIAEAVRTIRELFEQRQSGLSGAGGAKAD